VNPLSGLYGAVTQLRNLIYGSGFFSAQLHGPVISVGSISAGGAGKTPLVILLGELLKARQVRFDVLSRGYGRKTRGVRLVDPAGDAAQFGDEPLLIARRLGVPVVVGENRYHAGLLAEQRFGAQLHLLDDGFQHRALARDFDVVLLTALDARDRLLPIGRLREPLSSLARADAIAISCSSEEPNPPPTLVEHTQHRWKVHRSMTLPPNAPQTPIGFCGIARPNNFFAALENAGIRFLDKIAFPDHHSYGDHDVERLLRLRRENSADGFVTTEKDAVNLGAHRSVLEPLALAQVQMELEDADRVISHMLEAVAARHQARS
jgi:tetraacyldisaccharide 4'-kinase